jgi:threonyl-tRNA synthetase
VKFAFGPPDIENGFYYDFDRDEPQVLRRRTSRRIEANACVELAAAFKLMKVAGAYWRGDSRNADAAAHLRHGLPATRRTSTPTCSMLEEAEKRDHRAGPRARPLPHAGRGPGHGVLAPEGLDPFSSA